MASTARLDLPYIAAGQAQKHVTHNDALTIIDALVHLAVESRAQPTPPPSPIVGVRYLIPLGATGDWLGRDGAIAAEDSSSWVYHRPQAGWRVFVRDEAQLIVFDGTSWAPLVRRAESFGVNTDADSTNRLAVSSPAALFNHAGSDMRLAVNKAVAADVGTLQFQTGFAAQAELGLIGDNDLRVKISDGATLRQAMVVKSGTGRVGIGVAEPAAELEVADSSGDADCRIQLRADASQIAQFGVSSTQVFIDTSNEKPFLIYVNGAARAYFDAQGNVGIGIAAPTTRLDVDGPVKVKSYAKAALPTPAVVGPGAIAYVSDESAGPVLAFSDGTIWRRVTDRSAVT